MCECSSRPSQQKGTGLWYCSLIVAIVLFETAVLGHTKLQFNKGLFAPRVHRLRVGNCCARFCICLEGAVPGKIACLLLCLLKAANNHCGLCRAAFSPARKWAEGLPNASIPGAEDHADHVPATYVPFLYYRRLNNSKPKWPVHVAIRTCKIGMSETGWVLPPYVTVCFPIQWLKSIAAKVAFLL